MTLGVALLSVVIGLLVIPPVIYYGMEHVTSDDRVSLKKAVIVALLGIVVTGGLEFLFGWVPVVGVVVAPFAWIAVIRGGYPVSWPVAAAVGLTSWALPTLVIRFLVGL